MRKPMLAVFTGLALATSGCYHAVIETGQAPGAGSIDIPWAHSFIYGLVPPNVVDAAEECPGGVAQVVTEHSFVNGLAAFLTFGIYTPMHLNVTCAGGSASLDLPMVDSLAEAQARLDAGESFLLPLGAGSVEASE